MGRHGGSGAYRGALWLSPEEFGDSLKGLPNLVIRVESVKQAFNQAFLSRGDRRIAHTLLRVAGQDGRWAGAFKKEGIDPNFYALRQREAGEIFPWEVTDHGVARETLFKIYQKAVAGRAVCR